MSSCSISYSRSVSLVTPPEVSCRRAMLYRIKIITSIKDTYFFNLLPYELWERTWSDTDAISILEVRTTAMLGSATVYRC